MWKSWNKNYFDALAYKLNILLPACKTGIEQNKINQKICANIDTLHFLLHDTFTSKWKTTWIRVLGRERMLKEAL